MENSQVRLEFTEGNSHKYYEVFVREREGIWEAVAHYGRIGNPDPAVNVFASGLPDRYEAVLKAQAQISKKIKKGYKITEGVLA